MDDITQTGFSPEIHLSAVTQLEEVGLDAPDGRAYDLVLESDGSIRVAHPAA